MASSFSTPVELGLTIPLQRHLHIKALPYGGEPDRRFCWDLHVILLRGRPSLLAVHCYSRYTFVLYDLGPSAWARLPDVFRAGLEDSLSAAGFQAVPGVAASGDWFGRDLDRAVRIRDEFGALVCDMEAAAIAQVCLRNAVPFRCVRVVSDHLFHPSQYEEYQANLPAAVAALNRALAAAMDIKE